MPSPHMYIYILLLALRAASNPLPLTLPEPTPPPLATPCTTYLTKTISGFQGTFTPKVVYTVYTATDTVFSYVPCNGCTLSVTGILAPNYGGVGPQEVITATTTATKPYNVTSVVCSPTDNLGQPPGHRIPNRDQEEDEDETPNDVERVSKKPPPTDPATKSECPAYAAETSSSAHVISVPGAMRSNPIQPTKTGAAGQEHERRLQVPTLAARQQQPVTTITLTSKSWSTTVTSTKSTTCRLGPVQDPDPGAIPKKRDSADDQVELHVGKRRTTPGSQCGTSLAAPTPANTKTQMRTAYTTITVPVTGTLTRTTVRCMKTMLTRPWPRPTRSIGPD